MLEKLKEQMEKCKFGGEAVGTVLLKLCEGDHAAAQLVEQDLENPDMSLHKCLETMRQIAKKKQKAGCYYMPPEEAEKIIREFYGIPAAPQAAAMVPEDSGILDITDLM